MNQKLLIRFLFTAASLFMVGLGVSKATGSGWWAMAAVAAVYVLMPYTLE